MINRAFDPFLDFDELFFPAFGYRWYNNRENRENRESKLLEANNFKANETEDGKVEVIIPNINQGVNFDYTTDGRVFNYYLHSQGGEDGSEWGAASMDSKTLPREVEVDSGKVYYNGKTKEVKVVFDAKPEPEDKFVEVKKKKDKYFIA